MLGVACSASDRQEAEEAAEEVARDAGELAKEGAEAVGEAADDVAEAATEVAGDVADAAAALSHDLAAMFEGTKEEVVSRSEKALDQLGAVIKDLENKAVAAEDGAKEERDKGLAEMKKLHQEASEHLGRMKSSTEETWDEAADDFKSAFGDMQKGLKDLIG
jgi:ABC-type transporter Mla subunit MlaD